MTEILVHGNISTTCEQTTAKQLPNNRQRSILQQQQEYFKTVDTCQVGTNEISNHPRVIPSIFQKVVHF